MTGTSASASGAGRSPTTSTTTTATDARPLNCKVPPGDLEALVALDPDRFHVPAYLGARGWLGVRLDGRHVDRDEIARFVGVSYRLVAPKRLAALAGRGGRVSG